MFLYTLERTQKGDGIAVKRTSNTQTYSKRRTNVQKSIDLLRKKRFLEAMKEAAQEQLARYAPGTVSWNACRERLTKAEEALAVIHCAYEVLTPYQRDLLDTFFSSGERYCADRLCERYYKERSALYRDRRRALDDFTLAAFGD